MPFLKFSEILIDIFVHFINLIRVYVLIISENQIRVRFFAFKLPSYRRKQERQKKKKINKYPRSVIRTKSKQVDKMQWKYRMKNTEIER